MSARTAMSVVVASVAFAAAQPAAAAEPTTPTLLALTVATAHGTKDVRLRCAPPGGSHPHPADACADLTRAGGFDKLANYPKHEMCPDVYSGITASATGTWNGRPVKWTHEYPNDCCLNRSTGPVFDF